MKEFKPIQFYDLVNSREEASETSKVNQGEASGIIKLIQRILVILAGVVNIKVETYQEVSRL